MARKHDEGDEIEDEGRAPARALTSDELNRVLEVMANESDRGCVLSVVSLLDDALEMILRNKFEKSTDESGDFTKTINLLLIKQPIPPLGSAAIGAHACYVLGLIDRRLWRALDELRRLRNNAAHNPMNFSLQGRKFPQVKRTMTPGDDKILDLLDHKHAREKFDEAQIKRFKFTTLTFSVYLQLMAIAVAPEKAKETLAERKGLGERIEKMPRASHISCKPRSGSSADDTPDA